MNASVPLRFPALLCLVCIQTPPTRWSLLYLVFGTLWTATETDELEFQSGILTYLDPVNFKK
jgi:hypothetical protein